MESEYGQKYEIEIENFEEFDKKITEIKSQLDRQSRPLLFRGLSSSKWKLETTYERWLPGTPGIFSFNGYYRIALKVKSQIESFSDNRWEGSENPTDDEFQFNYYNSIDERLPYYSYLVYLRHHGFPSPLLDWSSSEYVAAYFAFQKEQGEIGSNDDKVAVYVYCERPKRIKSGSEGTPTIKRLGPYVTTHPRHFNQKSEYTICGNFIENKWSFVPHHDVFDDPSKPVNQDHLWKLVIPSNERSNFLKKFDQFNLNQYSLFQTEEAMLDVLAFRTKEELLGEL